MSDAADTHYTMIYEPEEIIAHMTQTNKERKANERQRKKELGLVRLDCWCTPEQKAAMKAILAYLQSEYCGPLVINSLNIEVKKGLRD